LDAITKKHEEVETSVKKLGATATKVFPSWATMVGKIFHDTSVRAAEMRLAMRDIKLRLPPVAVNLPKMSFNDLWLFIQAWTKKTTEEIQTSLEKSIQAAISGARDVVGGLDSVFAQFHANEAMRIDNEEKKRTDAIESWFEREQAKIEATITDEEELVAALEALDEEKARKENKLQHDMDKERRKLERARAKSQKATALFSAGINVAEAITKAFTAGPLIGQILAGIVAALGAIQIAAIAAAPLPALAKGGGLVAGEPGLVGERGPELFVPATTGTIVPLRESTPAHPGRGITGGAGPFHTTVYLTINAQRLDDRTINDAAEKIYVAVNRQARRY